MIKQHSKQLNLERFTQTLAQENILNSQKANQIIGGRNLDLVLVWTKPTEDGSGS